MSKPHLNTSTVADSLRQSEQQLADMNATELQNMASQLACPHGERAATVAEMMANNNSGMIKHAIEHLQLQAEQQVLELGYGAATHVPRLLSLKPNLRYTGLERSDAMVKLASANNIDAINHNKASFYGYAGNELPKVIYDSAPFSRLFSVNTLYFWQHPTSLLQQLLQVADKEAILNLTFSPKSFMQHLPFCQYGFQLYNEQDVATLAQQSGWQVQATHHMQENVVSKDGIDRIRPCITMILKPA